MAEQMTDTQTKCLYCYTQGLEAAALEYAAKYGISEQLMRALDDKPTPDIYEILSDLR